MDVRGIAGCAIAIAGAGLAWYYAKDFSDMGAVFPRTIAAVMMILAAVYIAFAVLRPKAQAKPAPGSAARRAGLVAVMVAWSALLEPLGFLTTSIACFTAILAIANYDRWTPRLAVTYAIAGAVILGGLYAIFRFVLQVPLPTGLML
jgi:putative tricarboxylic transport membrane protein